MDNRRSTRRLFWALLIGLGLLATLVAVPRIDLVVSGLFYTPETSFVWRDQPIPEFIHEAIQYGARIAFVLLTLGLLASVWRHRRNPAAETTFGLRRKEWLFLLTSLLIAPGLVANTILKDNWDRARPVHVEQFGGDADFSPPLVISDQCEDNCSFVSGDAAIGFWLHAFAYVVRRRSGLVLAGGLGCGALAGLLRIGMGGHFFSDVIFAGVFMVLTTALLHAAFFGPGSTAAAWRRWTGWLGGARATDTR